MKAILCSDNSKGGGGQGNLTITPCPSYFGVPPPPPRESFALTNCNLGQRACHQTVMTRDHGFFSKGTSPEGQRLNREIAQKLDGLNAEMQHALLQQEQSGVRRPANTYVGKMDQVHQWLNNPSSDPTRLGECRPV